VRRFATNAMRERAGVGERSAGYLAEWIAKHVSCDVRLADAALVAAVRPQRGSRLDPARDRPKKYPTKRRIRGGGGGHRTRHESV